MARGALRQNTPKHGTFRRKIRRRHLLRHQDSGCAALTHATPPTLRRVLFEAAKQPTALGHLCPQATPRWCSSVSATGTDTPRSRQGQAQAQGECRARSRTARQQGTAPAAAARQRCTHPRSTTARSRSSLRPVRSQEVVRGARRSTCRPPQRGRLLPQRFLGLRRSLALWDPRCTGRRALPRCSIPPPACMHVCKVT